MISNSLIGNLFFVGGVISDDSMFEEDFVVLVEIICDDYIFLIWNKGM